MHKFYIFLRCLIHYYLFPTSIYSGDFSLLCVLFFLNLEIYIWMIYFLYPLAYSEFLPLLGKGKIRLYLFQLSVFRKVKINFFQSHGMLISSFVPAWASLIKIHTTSRLSLNYSHIFILSTIFSYFFFSFLRNTIGHGYNFYHDFILSHISFLQIKQHCGTEFA